jgi:hypothetical protein
MTNWLKIERELIETLKSFGLRFSVAPGSGDNILELRDYADLEEEDQEYSVQEPDYVNISEVARTLADRLS